MNSQNDLWDYTAWVSAYDTLTDKDREQIRLAIRKMDHRPIFSVAVLESENSDISASKLTTASIQAQIYPHWELLLTSDLDGGKGADYDPRIRRFQSASDTSSTFNAAVAAASGDFILPLPQAAMLSESALYEVAFHLERNVAADIIYSDEDEIHSSGERSRPRFKPDWDALLALSQDLPGLLVVYRRAFLDRIGGMRPGEQNIELALFDLSLRASATTSALRIVHIPAILCHRSSELTPRFKVLDGEMRKIVRRHLRESKVVAEVLPATLSPNLNWVRFPVPVPAPLVSVIVATKDHPNLLERCAVGVLNRTDYPAIELLIVDNGSEDPDAMSLLHWLSADPRVRVLSCPFPFNYAKLNNIAAREARGEVFILLNNDIDVIDKGWLNELVSHVVRPGVGAVGAKLLYPDGRIQHAGVVLGPASDVTHQLRFADRNDPGPMGELAVARTVSAVTGACLAIRRAVFFEIGGLNEEMKVAYNDIDLCLRLGDHGYRIVWTPNAELYHLESATRGYDEVSAERQVLARQEAKYFGLFWRQTLQLDPFHNPNIVYGHDRTTLSMPPRLMRPWVFGEDRQEGAPAADSCGWSCRPPPNLGVFNHAEERKDWEHVLARIQKARAQVYEANLRADKACQAAEHSQAITRQAQEAIRIAELNVQEARSAAQRAERSSLEALNEAKQRRLELDRFLSSTTVRVAMVGAQVASHIPPRVRQLLVKGVKRCLKRR